MSFDNICGNLLANLIWVPLAWGAFRLRARFKADSEKRKEMAAVLGALFSHASDLPLRQDGVLLAELVMASSRRLLAENHFFTLACLISFFGVVIAAEVHPNRGNLLFLACGFLPLCSCAYYTLRSSNDIEAYEASVISGLNRRIQEKTKGQAPAQIPPAKQVA
ncbi:MAG: hypothetical protein JWR69_3999 [Pedosphaera sp.]|nr:hypothetical protein [Pedosphaera sp.]